MFATIGVVLYFVLHASVVAQSPSSLSVVCVAGQCLQGFSNTTIGAKLSATGAPTSIHLLPGQYTSTTNPQLLHNLLTSSSASLTPSPGFESASLSSLPLNLQLSAGLAIYSQPFYSGQPSFSQLPSTPLNSSSVSLGASSLAISSNVWVAVTSNSSSSERVILWDSIPDLSQLPSSSSRSLSLVDIQSSSCSPPCSGSGVCSASGTCTCPSGFAGSSCESCADGFFGPSCQACPAGCAKCDQGISGSGRCLVPAVQDAPSTCNCLNGKCNSNGQCTCNAGWTTSDNGTACAKCTSGFFLTTTGDCQVCQLGCTQCADNTATCVSCKTGFTQDANDKTKCNPVPSQTTDGTRCPDGSFSNGSQCATCSPSCRTCNGPTSNDCTLCAAGSYLFNGNCVSANSDGVCEGSGGFIADNNKNECDTCGAKCTSCKIPSFSVASTVNQLQCTGCLPGFVLSQGKCVESCPSGTFVSPQDNLTCTPCSSSCGTCAGSADFCLTCSGGQLASSGKCVSTCPSNSFSSSGSCIKCHPDCASCSGSSFNQCSSCPPSRPVLTNGRCLPTCSKSQFFDTTSSTCQSCDSSCSSCSGSGPKNCLACSNANQVLRAGSCVAANCQASSSVVPSLGVCLSELVSVPSGSGTTASPLPTITGLSDPTVIKVKKQLEWWEILLMALGCAFIFVAILWCWRRRARKQREKRTKMFAKVKKLDGPQHGWRWKLVRFGEKLFGHKKSTLREAGEGEPELPVAYNHHERSSVMERRDSWTSERFGQDIKLKNMAPTPTTKLSKSRSKDFLARAKSFAESRNKRETMDDLLSAYEYSRHDDRTSRAPSLLPSLDERRKNEYTERLKARIEQDQESLYAEVTGNRRNTPEPRQPMKKDLSPLSGASSRFSRSSRGSSIYVPALTNKLKSNKNEVLREDVLVDLDDRSERIGWSEATLPLQMNATGPGSNMTEAQAYMKAVRPGLNTTGASAGSPFPFQNREQPLPQFHPVPTFAAAASLPPPTTTTMNVNLSGAGGAGAFMPIPVTLTPNTTGGQGSYWLTPVVPMPQTQLQSQPLQQQPSGYLSEDTVVLQPMLTGASTGSSRNPFRKGSY